MVRKALARRGFEILRLPLSPSALDRFSMLDEQPIVARRLERLNPSHRFCVDIGASDGTSMSNSCALYLEGWAGLAVEADAVKFSKLARAYAALPAVGLARCKVTPLNARALLEGHGVPEDFGFLSLDIDGYDYFVLRDVLSRFRPRLVCVEINENIPPPLKFTVTFDPGYAWAADHFFGQSISQVSLLCHEFRYSLVELHYNNAFLVPDEINPFPSLTAEEAYATGYRDRPDRKAKFPWNAPMEELLGMQPSEAMTFIRAFFRKYEGRYSCSL
jgi:hypothetical protein